MKSILGQFLHFPPVSALTCRYQILLNWVRSCSPNCCSVCLFLSLLDYIWPCISYRYCFKRYYAPSVNNQLFTSLSMMTLAFCARISFRFFIVNKSRPLKLFDLGVFFFVSKGVFVIQTCLLYCLRCHIRCGWKMCLASMCAHS